MFRFPFGTVQELNLDWFLEQWEIFKVQAREAFEGIDHALDDEIDRVETAMTDLYTARDAAIAAKNAAETAEGSTIGYAQSAANSAASAAGSATGSAQSASSSAGSAEQAAQSAQTSAQQASSAATSAGNAATSASNASSSAATAANNATIATNYSQESAAWATGSYTGDPSLYPVPSTAPQHENNAKYYAESISGDAAIALSAASQALAQAAAAAESAASVSASAAQIAQNASDIADLQTDMTAAESAITELQTDLDAAESDIAGLQTDMTAALGDISTLQTDLDAAESDISTLQTDLDAAESDINGLQNAMTSSNLEVEQAITLSFIQGSIGSNGGNAGSSQKIRTNDYYAIYSDLEITFSKGNYPATIYLDVYLYDANNTYISDQVINNEGTFTFAVGTAKKVRFLVSTKSGDTETIIAPADGPTLVSASQTIFQNVAPDTTLTQENRPADSKATGDAIKNVGKTLFNNELSFDWQRGKISNTGTNSQSSSTVYIRTNYRYKIEKINNHLTVPNNTTVEIYSYSIPYGDGFIEQVGTYTQNTDIALTVGTYVRLVAYYTDLSDTPLSVGDSVKLSYYKDAQTFYDNYSDYKLNDYSCISMFETLGIVGDSWASGSIYAPDGTFVDTVYSMSWGQILARKNGITTTNYSEGGLSTPDWLSDNDHGLATLLTDSAKNLYIINLGINDNTQIENGTLTLGTIADVNTEDFTQRPYSIGFKHFYIHAL